MLGGKGNGAVCGTDGFGAEVSLFVSGDGGVGIVDGMWVCDVEVELGVEEVGSYCITS